MTAAARRLGGGRAKQSNCYSRRRFFPQPIKVKNNALGYFEALGSVRPPHTVISQVFGKHAKNLSPVQCRVWSNVQELQPASQPTRIDSSSIAYRSNNQVNVIYFLPTARSCPVPRHSVPTSSPSFPARAKNPDGTRSVSFHRA